MKNFHLNILNLIKGVKVCKKNREKNQEKMNLYDAIRFSVFSSKIHSNQSNVKLPIDINSPSNPGSSVETLIKTPIRMCRSWCIRSLDSYRIPLNTRNRLYIYCNTQYIMGVRQKLLICVFVIARYLPGTRRIAT